MLNELHPEATFSLVEATGPSHSPQFCIRATLGQLQFEVGFEHFLIFTFFNDLQGVFLTPPPPPPPKISKYKIKLEYPD